LYRPDAIPFFMLALNRSIYKCRIKPFGKKLFIHLIVSLIINFSNMKRTFASGLKTLIALFVLLTGLFFAVNRVEAQTSLSGQQNYNWKTVSEVTGIAKTTVEFWHTQGPFSPGTANYYNQMRHAAFYKSVMNQLAEGASVSTAVNQSLSSAATVGGEKEAAFTSKTVLNAIRQEAIELFTN
jgi:uncharacterized membrane protein (GlpM family)